MSESLQITDSLTTQEVAALNRAGVFPPFPAESLQVGFGPYSSLVEQGEILGEDFEDPFIGELPIIPYES